ncbi:major facilitator superfamily domain-containing protein [Ditylenchus destructor]|nr:major facilitator superfamily domain-containing protein [Ditylenchus destructor]
MRFNVWDNKYIAKGFAGEVRLWVLAVTTLLLVMVYANPNAFNFTIICMLPPESEESYNLFQKLNYTREKGQLSNHDEKIVYDDRVYYDYSPIHMNALFSASALGTLFGTFPLSYFVSKYNVRYTFSAYALVSALTTLLIPLSAQIGYPVLFALRIIQGFGGSASLMMLGSVTNAWSPLASAGTFMIILSTHYQFGPILIMPTAAGLCESRWGWPMVYYFQGSLTLILLLIFFAFFRDSPREHPLVNQKELDRIEKGKDVILKQKCQEREAVPYKAIFTDYMVWIVWLGFFGDEVAYQIFQQYGPLFLNKALGMNIQDTGYAAALPFIVSIVTKLIAGPISDRMTCISDRSRINIFAVLSQGGCIICYACLALFPILMTDVPTWLMQVFYTSVNMFCGLAFLGMIKSAAVIAKQYSHVTMTGVCTTSSLIILILPLVVSLIVPDNTLEQWTRLFIGMPFIQLTTTTIFLIFCDSKPRPWTKRDQKPDIEKFAALK